MSFNQSEIEEFKLEAFELLEAAEESLLVLDNGQFEDFEKHYDTIFRSFHNLKGAAGMMNLDDLQAHTHELETLFVKFKGQKSIPSEYVSLFLKGVDSAKSILNGQKIEFNYNVTAQSQSEATSSSPLDEELVTKKAVVSDTTPANPNTSDKAIAQAPEANNQITLSEGEQEFIAEARETLERVSLYLQLIEDKQYSKDTVDALYRDIHSLKGGAYLFSLNNLGSLCHTMESSLEDIRDGLREGSSDFYRALSKCIDLIEKILIQYKTTGGDQSCQAEVQSLVELVNQCSAETATDTSAAQPAVFKDTNTNKDETVEVKATEELPSPTSNKTESAANGNMEDKGASSIRVSVSLLDHLMNLMSEMVLVRNQVLQYSNKMEDSEFLSMSKRLNSVTVEIQEEMMKTRMQPIGNTLNKFNRVVRDLSRDLGKDIRLNLKGLETDLDRSLLEAIKDPLTHIIRNSCDHGIEDTEDRIAKGKPSQGMIEVNSYHEGGQVVIDITDDGKGLNAEILKKKAIEKGILNSAQALQMSDKEALNLIFAPGFSTAAAVTNVSGRGVGMDVVRTNVEKIGGTIDLSSQVDKGTNIKIKIPLTLAIVPALLVKCESRTFSIPQARLEELVRVEANDENHKIEILHGVPVYRLRGKLLPLVDLKQVLGLRKEKIDYNKQSISIAVVNADFINLGLIIDEVLDTSDIVVKPLNRLLKSLGVYSGATILGDGDISLILDIVGIAKLALTEFSYRQESQKKEDDEASKMQSENQDFLLVQLNSATKHAFVLNYIHRIEEFNQNQIEMLGHQQVVRYRDTVLPLVNLDYQLGYTAETHIDKNLATVSVVVVQRAGLLYGLVVDKILDTLTTKNEANLSHADHPCIMGSLSLQQELVVIVDPYEVILKSYPDLKVVEVNSEVKNKPSRPMSINARGGKLNILLAEDTVFFRRVIANILEAAGHHVVVANDGREAAEKLNTSQLSFDLIVSDIEMPRMNGFELAQFVRNNDKYKHIPMVAVSSRADGDYTAQGIKSGYDVYLEKLKPDLLLSKISELFYANDQRAA